MNENVRFRIIDSLNKSVKHLKEAMTEINRHTTLVDEWEELQAAEGELKYLIKKIELKTK